MRGDIQSRPYPLMHPILCFLTFSIAISTTHAGVLMETGFEGSTTLSMPGDRTSSPGTEMRGHCRIILNTAVEITDYTDFMDLE